MNTRFQALLALASACALSLLAGCSTSFVPSLDSENPSASSRVGGIQGNVHGGQQPVSGARIYVMQAATTGYGALSTSLITTNYSGSDSIGKYVLTTSGGSFSLAGDYTCTSGSQVYLLAEQGNPGLVTGTNNTAIGMMAALGTCPSTGTLAANVPFVVINEVSTVVAAYSLAGYATDALHISSSNTALAAVGLKNAFAAVPNMLNVGTGYSLATTAAGNNGTVPVSAINTLANILASCINSSGPTQGGCPTLFANATADGTSTGARPSETATAAINIAHHPAQGPAALFALQSATAPFLPDLSAAPNDFTMKIYYTGGGLNKSSQLAVDGSGNVWVSSQGNNSLNEFSPLGAPLSGNSGFTGGGLSNPYGVAIDIAGNAWVANFGGANVSKFNSSGVSQAGTTGFKGNNDLSPYQIAIDKNGYVWTTNYNNGTVSKISSAGVETVNSSTQFYIDQPAGIAIDANNQPWVSVFGDGFTLVLNNNDADYNSYFFCDYACRFLELTSGSSPSAWVSNGTTTVSKATNNSLGTTDYTGGGLNNSTSNILDGAGNVWVTNLNGTVSEFTGAGSAITPATGYLTALSQTYGIAVDGSGNVWVTDNGTTSGTQLAEFVGAATPTVTPLVQAVINNNIAGKP